MYRKQNKKYIYKETYTQIFMTTYRRHGWMMVSFKNNGIGTKGEKGESPIP